MNLLYLTGVLFLSFYFGRNNMSNIFGTAVGTRMISLFFAATIACIFLTLGAFISADGTTANITELSHVRNMHDAFVVCVSVGLVLVSMSKKGIPVSISQSMVGAFVAWNMYHGIASDEYLVKKMVLSWFLSPFLAALISFTCFKILHYYLKNHPVGLFHRDYWTRFGLVFVGAFFAYALGANNIGNLIAPYMPVISFSPVILLTLVCVCVSIGFYLASRKTITTVGTSIFPLSPVEAFVVIFSGALVLLIFSFAPLRTVLTAAGIVSVPMVPIAVSAVVVGSIVGISIAKGGFGLKYKTLVRIILSWITVPVFSGLICWGILAMLSVTERLT